MHVKVRACHSMNKKRRAYNIIDSKYAKEDVDNDDDVMIVIMVEAMRMMIMVMMLVKWRETHEG